MPEVSKMREQTESYLRSLSFNIWRDPRIRALRYNYRMPAEYCNYCRCQHCRIYFASGLPKRAKVFRPKYSYVGPVNYMRQAAAKLEEDRQEKLRAEREVAATSVQALKKE